MLNSIGAVGNLFFIAPNVDSLRGFSEWHKTKLRINTNNHKHTTNNKFINQAENHRKEIVMSRRIHREQD